MKKRKVFFYGAGEHADLIFNLAKAKTEDHELIAFIDQDTLKQGETSHGVPVVSFQTAVDLYRDEFDIYITANERNTPDIIGFLIERGVDRVRILNYEPVEKRNGCEYLESVLLVQFIGEVISFKPCSRISECGAKYSRPEFNINPSDISNEVIHKVNDYMGELVERIKINKIPFECKNCGFVKYKYFFKERKIRRIIFGGNVGCNYNCFHCTNNILFTKYRSDVYEDLNNIWDAIERSQDTHEMITIAFGVGEFSIFPNHKQFLEKISKYPLMMYTNADEYSLAVDEILKKGKASITVSLDAGTESTYKKIKGVDGFEKVCSNILKYSESGIVNLKYIMFEGINVNEIDINKFKCLADEVATKVLISRDFYQNGVLGNYTLEKIAELMLHFRKGSKLSKTIGIERETEQERLKKILEVQLNVPR